jgi:methionine-gamma-lyase
MAKSKTHSDLVVAGEENAGARTVLGTATMAIHAGQHADPQTGAVVTPIYQCSTFAFQDADHGAALFAGRDQGYIYTRIGNPTVAALEENVAALEGGAGALVTASGMAAIGVTYLSLLSQGDHVVAGDALYGPSRILLEQHLSRLGIESTFVDTSDLDQVRQAIRSDTRMVYIETPANPTICLTDIAACARLAHSQDALLVVDNTFMSPVLQRPLELGADIVLHSMTKFLNGHADVVAGVVATRTPELLAHIRPLHVTLGAVMDPHQAWLVLRGIKTLPMRVRTAQANAQRLAAFLEEHPAVAWVRYPGLESHPQHELAKRQMEGPGALMSLELAGGLDAGMQLMNHVHVATLAVSLGGVETLVQHPASMTHAGLSADSRAAAGISDGLVRISVGCEDYADLEADFSQALAECSPRNTSGNSPEGNIQRKEIGL